MTNQTYFLQLTLMIAATLIFTGCAKEDQSNLSGAWKLSRTGSDIFVTIQDKDGVLSGETFYPDELPEINKPSNKVSGVTLPDGTVELIVYWPETDGRIEFNGTLAESDDKFSGKAEWWIFGKHMADGDPTKKPESFVANRFTRAE